MAKRASPASTGTTKRKRAAARPKTKAAARKPARAASADRRKSGRRSSDLTAADALIKLIESPLVADLLAVGATAALAAVASSSLRKGDDGRRSSSALKAAAKAAAAAMGQRLSTEVEEIRKASKKTRASAKA